MRIAILAVQGAFLEHEKILDALGVEYFEIRRKSDIEQDFDGLILPGGESTTMGKLLHDLDLFDTLKSKIENGLPVFGTCAGMILLAKKLTNDSVTHLATMNISVKRNAYGRQLGSFDTKADFGNLKDIHMVFIRAPYIEEVGDGVEVLSTVDGNIVAAQQGNQLAVSFHPELIPGYTEIHRYFIENIIKQNI